MAGVTVAQLMHHDVPVLREDAPYKQVAVALAAYHVGALPVVDPTGRITGIVSESDLIQRPASESDGRRLHHRKAHARTAAALMTHPVVHVSPDTTVFAAARIAAQADVGQLPVLDGDKLVGMVERADLLAGYLRSDDTIRAEIVNRVIVDDFCIDPGCVDVTVRDGVVLLSGCVEHRPLGALLLGAVRAVPGVVDVEDRLTWRHDFETTDPRMRRRAFP